MTEKTRAYIYRVLLALTPLVVLYGYLTEEQAALWVGVASALLGNGLAVANTSTGRTFTQRLVNENQQLRTIVQAHREPGTGRHRADG